MPNNDWQQSIKQILRFSDSSTGSKSLGKNSGNFHFGKPNFKTKCQASSKEYHGTATDGALHRRSKGKSANQFRLGHVRQSVCDWHLFGF
jgi:hypothetical protein